MPDVNEIQAGEYELVADHWDETTSKVGEPWTYVRHYKGEKVTLTQEDARRLVPSGAVVEPGARELAEARRLKAHFQALLAQMPDELRAQLQEDDPAKLAEAAPQEVPVEARRVGDEGSEIQNDGERPRVASASSGEGDGEVQEPGADEAVEPAKAARRSGRS